MLTSFSSCEHDISLTWIRAVRSVYGNNCVLNDGKSRKSSIGGLNLWTDESITSRFFCYVSGNKYCIAKNKLVV